MTTTPKKTHFYHTVRQMAQLAWSAKPSVFVLTLLLQIILGTSPGLTAWITKQLFDILASGMQAGGEIPSALVLYLLLQAAATVLYLFLESINRYCNAELSRGLSFKTQSLFYQKVNDLQGLNYFENPAFHDTLQLASQGLQNGPQQILSILTTVVQQIMILVCFAGMLLIFSPLLAALMLVVSLVRLSVQMRISRQRIALSVQSTPKERQVFYLGSVLSQPHFAKEIRLFGLKDHFLSRFLRTFSEIQNFHRRQERREMTLELGLGLFSALVTMSAFFAVIWQAFHQHLTVGDVLLYTSALGSIGGALTGIVMALSNLDQNALFFNHFLNLLAVTTDATAVKPLQPVPVLTYGIELKDVSFRYADDLPWVLEQVNLYIPAGKCLAIVGLNGAGKTTLVKLLARLYDPVAGQILWDGVDIRAFDPQELRQHIGAVFQDFVHYELTARENIGVGNVAQMNNLPLIQKAAADAHVNAFITELPQQYETVLSRWLSEDGQGMDLSGGQWQRVAVARALMRDADFLMLDEPTAALDPAAEYDLYNQLVELISGRTSLLISHRFSTVLMADLIAVLENGKITEYGTHQELVRRGQTYAKLYAMQASRYLESDLSLLQPKV